MAPAVLLPQTAPFGVEERAHLDRVLSAATPVQRAWLAGFLAGIDHAAAPAVPAAASAPVEPLTILFASESGNAERIALDAAKLARKSGFKPKVADFADLEIAALPNEARLLVVASTWGEGEPPARAARAYNELMGPNPPRLDSIPFAVLSLGDSAYSDFCGIGKAIDARLEALGGKRIADRVDCDLDFEDAAAEWTKRVLKTLAPAREASTNVVAVDFAARPSTEVGREIVTAEVVEHIDLNSSRSEKETIHLVLGFDGAAPPYEPGDSLDVFAPNDPDLVGSVLLAAGLADDDGLRAALRTERDITTLSLPVVEKYAAITGRAELQRLIDEKSARAWIEGRQLLDLLEGFRAKLTAADLTALTRPLPPRAYSIASSRREVGEEAHLLVAAVRYESHGRWRSGVASTHIADRSKPQDTIRVRLKPNRHFRLPDPATDIIMVGPGTGVAPFRAFVQERRATGAGGRNWLFFGDRQFTHDFLYQLEWQDALADGSLARLDLAFSRDTPEKVYVQHRLWERRRELVAWLDGGAHFYLCGDAKRMAKDVRATLVRILADVRALSPDAAEAAVGELERGRRYLQDVY